MGSVSLILDLFKFSIFSKIIIGVCPRFIRCLIGVVNRPFIRRFVSFWGTFLDPVPEPVFGGLNRPFVRGSVFNFGFV